MTMTPIERARREFLTACECVDNLKKSQYSVMLKADGGYARQEFTRQVQAAVARKQAAFHQIRLLEGRAAEPLRRPVRIR